MITPFYFQNGTQCQGQASSSWGEVRSSGVFDSSPSALSSLLSRCYFACRWAQDTSIDSTNSSSRSSRKLVGAIRQPQGTSCCSSRKAIDTLHMELWHEAGQRNFEDAIFGRKLHLAAAPSRPRLPSSAILGAHQDQHRVVLQLCSVCSTPAPTSHVVRTHVFRFAPNTRRN